MHSRERILARGFLQTNGRMPYPLRIYDTRIFIGSRMLTPKRSLTVAVAEERSRLGGSQEPADVGGDANSALGGRLITTTPDRARVVGLFIPL